MIAFWFMVAVVGTAVIALITVVVWVGERSKDREKQYRSETIKKIAESENSDAALEYAREVDKADASRGRNKIRIGGLVTLGVGLALMVFFSQLVPETAIYLVGLIPLLVGVSLLIASEVFMKPAD